MAGKRAPKGVTVDDLIELLNGDEQLAQLSKTRMKAELVGRVPGKIVDEYFATSATRQRLAKPGKLDAKLTLESGEEPLDGATPAKPVLYLGPLEWAPPARGKGSLPKDVVELVKQRYDTTAPEQ